MLKLEIFGMDLQESKKMGMSSLCFALSAPSSADIGDVAHSLAAETPSPNFLISAIWRSSEFLYVCYQIRLCTIAYYSFVSDFTDPYFLILSSHHLPSHQLTGEHPLDAELPKWERAKPQNPPCSPKLIVPPAEIPTSWLGWNGTSELMIRCNVHPSCKSCKFPRAKGYYWKKPSASGPMDTTDPLLFAEDAVLLSPDRLQRCSYPRDQALWAGMVRGHHIFAAM